MGKILPFLWLILVLSGCSGQEKLPTAPADVNAKIDGEIGEIQARKDLTPEAKTDIIRRLSAGKKAAHANMPPAKPGT